MVVDAAPIEPVSSLQFWEMQGDFRKMQGGGLRSPAEIHEFSNSFERCLPTQASREEQGEPSLLSSRVSVQRYSSRG
jgi:hypothetical protein